MKDLTDSIPHDLDGEIALELADFFYRLADEILRLNDGAIRIYYNEIDDMRRARASTTILPIGIPMTSNPTTHTAGHN